MTQKRKARTVRPRTIHAAWTEGYNAGRAAGHLQGVDAAVKGLILDLQKMREQRPRGSNADAGSSLPRS